MLAQSKCLNKYRSPTGRAELKRTIDYKKKIKGYYYSG